MFADFGGAVAPSCRDHAYIKRQVATPTPHFGAVQARTVLVALGPLARGTVVARTLRDEAVLVDTRRDDGRAKSVTK